MQYCSESSVKEEIASNNPNSCSRKTNLNMKSIGLHAFDERSTQGELSPILTCIRSIQGSEALWGSERLNKLKRLSLKELKNEQNLKYEDGFCFAVSLQDGSTLYVSSAITRHLGYPKDMLVGQCIMNFLYQKDHITFANHLTQGLNACFNQGIKDETHLVPNTFFCRLRLYHGLKFGYSISEKKTQYKPFKVTLHVNDLIFDDVCVEKVTSTLCVKATATPLSSAYQAPEEIPAMTSFSTRHTASCHFSHVDASAFPYLGYLPQDMIGYSVFDFYHIDDMPQLKDIYELVVKERGSSFRSKPYRFKVFNGCYITLETEWSCFINPWSRKLEFVVGQHRVLKGPVDINIFDPANMEETIASDESLKESQSVQKEIRSMLAQPIKDCVVGKTKRFCNKRKRDLASFVYNFIDDEGKEKKCDEKDIDDCNSSDSDSVVMGDISPHQDMNESSSFSETPPTCQELRYQENIERFFASQPKTLSDGAEECKSEEKLLSSDNSRGTGSNSKQQSSFPLTSSLRVGDDNKRQESSSTSSKYNMSSLTNGDSGYKSLEAVNPLPMSTSTASTQAWSKWEDNADVEKYPLCMTLTEESLLQHNRMNHKYIKHRKSKGNVTQTHKENDWLKHNELGNLNIGSSSHKPRKCARIQTTQPSTILTQQIEEPKTSLSQQSMFCLNPPFSIGTYGIPMGHSATTTTPSAPTSLTFPSFGVPSYPYMSSNYNHATPASPFFIPVMYMGPLSYYPSVPNVVPPSSVPVWPYTPVPPSASPVVFPAIPTGYPVPMSIIPTSQVPSSSVNSCSVQPSGATATTTVLTTTTTVAPGLETASEKQIICGNNKPHYCCNDDYRTCHISCHDRQKENFRDKDISMQIDDSISSSCTPLFQLENEPSEKTEDMDFESKFTEKCKRPIREDPPWLAGVNMTADVVYRYQMTNKNMEEVLMKDMETLKAMSQPQLVNKQLELLQHEFKDEKNAVVMASDSAVNNYIMLGLTTHDNNEKGEFMDNEDNLFEVMVQDE